jgi:hypothetical protein
MGILHEVEVQAVRRACHGSFPLQQLGPEGGSRDGVSIVAAEVAQHPGSIRLLLRVLVVVHGPEGGLADQLRDSRVAALEHMGLALGMAWLQRHIHLGVTRDNGGAPGSSWLELRLAHLLVNRYGDNPAKALGRCR